MTTHSFWLLVCCTAIAVAGFAMGGCGSDKTGTSGSAITDCDGGSGCSGSSSQGGGGGW